MCVKVKVSARCFKDVFQAWTDIRGGGIPAMVESGEDARYMRFLVRGVGAVRHCGSVKGIFDAGFRFVFGPR